MRTATIRAIAATMLTIAASTACAPLPRATSELGHGAPLPAPKGLVALCREDGFSCASAADGSVPREDVLTLTAASYRLIDRVNREVNAALVPVEDTVLHGRSEKWTLPLTWGLAAAGDCEDYALEKRQRLIEAGIAASIPMLAIGGQADGPAHAVLIVRTDRGDLVLDNLTDTIAGWQEQDFVWGAIHHPGRLLEWAAIEIGDDAPRSVP